MLAALGFVADPHRRNRQPPARPPADRDRRPPGDPPLRPRRRGRPRAGRPAPVPAPAEPRDRRGRGRARPVGPGRPARAQLQDPGRDRPGRPSGRCWPSSASTGPGRWRRSPPTTARTSRSPWRRSPSARTSAWSSGPGDGDVTTEIRSLFHIGVVRDVHRIAGDLLAAARRSGSRRPGRRPATARRGWSCPTGRTRHSHELNAT